MNKTFIEKITPEPMLNRFAEMRAQRSDLRVLYYILGEQRILEWIHSVGVCEDETLRSFVPMVPPLELRQITAAPDLPEFLWTGLVDMAQFISLFKKVAKLKSVENSNILDFACGCGRMVRFLNNHRPNVKVYACDVNPAHVKWCQASLANIEISDCDALPPLPYKEQMFHLIYGLSVFTHFSENKAIKWLSELHRVLKPNGILIITIHGIVALNTIRDSVQHQQMFNLDTMTVEQTIENFADNPYVFFNYDQSVIEDAKAGIEYGNAFIHPSYVFKTWELVGFKVVEIIPGGLRGWQDIVVLQRKT